RTAGPCSGEPPGEETQMNETVGLSARSPVAAADAAVEQESGTAQCMAEAATTFLASLSAEQRQRALFAADSEERLNWHYVPKERAGIPFTELDGSQRQLAHALLSSGLSRRGYAKAVTIMSLERV